jgi:hypothetical protein
MKFIDMTGWAMREHGVPESKWTVIRQSDSNNKKWLCECSCPNHTQKEVFGTSLRNGTSKSCGCETGTMISKNKMKHNQYSDLMVDEHGEYYIGFTSNTNEKFYIDADDFDKIKDYCWCESKSRSTDIAKRVCTSVDNKIVYMHQIIGFKGYDHADRNELNNRKYNLRPCTNSQNGANRNSQRNNTSGIIGVYWSTQREKWVSQIRFGQTRKTLGYFIQKEEAIKSRLDAEMKYFGDFAPQRHLFKQYNITIQND